MKFLKPGYQINNKICKAIALAFWEKYPSERITKTFKASSTWIRRFKKKHSLVNRKAHFKKRSPITEKTIQKSKEFLQTVSDLYAEHEKRGTLHYLVNIDETNWKFNNFGGLTWASKGTEHVECNIADDDKRGITALAAITASPDKYKLPLCLIKKGTTDRSLNVFDDVKQFFQIERTANGWTTSECFVKYLNWLRLELDERYKEDAGYSRETKIDIILDLYSAHRGTEVQKIAAELNSNLYYIPPSFTDAFQPLDRYVFGALKSMARARFYAEYVKDPSRHFSTKDACQILLECWSEISESTRRKAWLPYSEPQNTDFESYIYRKSINFVPEPSELTISDEDDIVVNFKEDSEDSDNEENEIIEIFIRESIDASSIIKEIKEIIKHEENLLEISMNDTIVKPISNDDGTCSVNVLIQILYLIPHVRDEIRELIAKKKGDINDVIEAANLCMSIYEEAEEKVDSFPADYCSVIPEDVTESITMIISQLSSQYGITLVEERHVTVMQNDCSLSITDAIDQVTQMNDFIIHKLIFFKKDPKTEYLYPEVVDNQSFIMVLKALIISEDEPKPIGHFRLYFRESFSEKWLMISDEQIKESSIEDTYEEPVCMTIYYVLHKQNTATEQITCERSITKPLEIPKALKSVLDEEHPECTFSGQIVTRNIKDILRSSNLEEITPRTRVFIKTAQTRK